MDFSTDLVPLPINDIFLDNSFGNSVDAISCESFNQSTVIPHVDGSECFVKTGDSFAHSPSKSDSLLVCTR